MQSPTHQHLGLGILGPDPAHVQLSLLFGQNIHILQPDIKRRARLRISYNGIPGLRLESIEKLSKVRPQNLAQASRIPGVNPSDLSVLMIMLRKS